LRLSRQAFPHSRLQATKRINLALVGAVRTLNHLENDMRTFYNTGPLPFAPAVKVKPLSKFWDSRFAEWRIEAKVTSRRDTYAGPKCGDLICARPASLFARQGVQRGKCGRLYWAERMTAAEFDSLPVSSITRD
jgi:hypothetical protein